MLLRDLRIVYADPPWSFKTFSDEGKDRAPEQHYQTMTIDDICAIPVKEWVADDALLYIWAYQPLLPETFTVMEAWGFKYTTIGFIWVKINGGQDRLFYAQEDVRKSLGYYTRAGGEICLIAKRGKGIPGRLSKSEAQVVLSPLREHSRKSDEIAESIVEMHGDIPRLEMFARTPRKGWELFGNETQKFENKE